MAGTSAPCRPPRPRRKASTRESSLDAVLETHVPVDAAVDGGPALAFGLASDRIGRENGAARLALELRVGVEPIKGEGAVIERGPNGAARFGAVLAVVEPARRGDTLDVVERGRDAVGIDDTQLAQPRCVDQQPVGEPDQLPARRRVAAARVVLADRGRVEELLARERIDDAGLADAG